MHKKKRNQRAEKGKLLIVGGERRGDPDGQRTPKNLNFRSKKVMGWDLSRISGKDLKKKKDCQAENENDQLGWESTTRSTPKTCHTAAWSPVKENETS